MHFSATQLTMPIDVWCYKYQKLTPEQRSAIPGGFAMYGGGAVGNGVAEHFDPDSVATAEARFGRTASFEGALAELKKREPRDYNDRIKRKDIVERERVVETIEAVKDNAIDAIKRIVGAWPCEAERKVQVYFKGCAIPIIGYIDIYVPDPSIIIELKTIWDNSHAGTKQGWAGKKLPTAPRQNHIDQGAIYWKALMDDGQEPELYFVYASKDGAITFAQRDCDQLSEENLLKSLQRMRIQAVVRENLLSLPRGLTQMTRFIAPDFDHAYMWEMPPENLAEAKAMWGIEHG